MYAPAASRDAPFLRFALYASCLTPGRRFRPRHFAEECGDSFRPSAGVSCRANRVSSIWRRAACFRIYFLLTLTLPKILRQPTQKLPTNSTVIFVSPAAATVSPHVRKCSLYVGSFILSNSFFIFAETLFLFRRHAVSGACPAGRRRGAAGQRDDTVGLGRRDFFRREVLDFRKL